jgi:hypothetical protein
MKKKKKRSNLDLEIRKLSKELLKGQDIQEYDEPTLGCGQVCPIM